MPASASDARPRLARRPAATAAEDRGRSDLGLLAFVLAVHVMPLVALAAGRSWGAGAEGYATAVLLVGGWELARELRDRVRGGEGRRP